MMLVIFLVLVSKVRCMVRCYRGITFQRIKRFVHFFSHFSLFQRMIQHSRCTALLLSMSSPLPSLNIILTVISINTRIQHAQHKTRIVPELN
ncbi:MAG: hypothetical protein JOS17DRAFT_746281 [Linnemannia elongata]|nr:MAG: hypothetical protein JOS17DRAFT_746281 [Linnemannia elongata]